MFIDTAGVIEAVMATSTPALLPLPTSTSSKHHHTSVIPQPTVYPGPSYEPEIRTETGVRALWVVFVIMTISSLAFYVMAWRQPASKRLFHVLTSFITTFAAISYASMAFGQGISFNTEHYHEHHKHGIPPTTTIAPREVYWARYVDWSVTTPLLLLDLAFLVGMSGADIVVTIVADLIMVLTGLFAGLSQNSNAKWTHYTVACAAYLVIVYQLAINGRAVVKTKDSKTATFFTSIAGFTLLLWTAYPIVWGIADGARILSVDGEIIAYAVLDVLAKPGFGFWLLFTHDSLASSSASIGGFWTHGLSTEGAIRVGDDEDGA